MHQASDQPRILMGGTGRCGTSILATLFEMHPEVLYFPEPHIWLKGYGLLQMVRGEITLEQYAQWLIERHRPMMVKWLAEHGHDGADEVYSVRNTRATLQWAFSLPGSRLEQAARFVDGLFSLGLRRWGGQTWAEKTPKTVMHVDMLNQMFPQMRYIHIFREPKDIFCSVRGKPWGPNNLAEFIHWYNDIMRRAWQARQGLDDGRYMTLSLEQLTSNPGQAARVILTFTGLSALDEVVERFAANVTARDSHTDRWREELSPEEVVAIDRHCSVMYQQWQLEAQRNEQSRIVSGDNLRV